MTTITKEEVKAFIEQIESDLANGWEAQIFELKLARIALASLEAEPIGAFHIADQQVGGTSDYIKDGEWPIDNGIIEVYAAPPATVVPEKLPCSVELKPGLIIGKGCKTETLLTALRRRADYYAKIDAFTPEERAEHDASIEAFKAMLPTPADSQGRPRAPVVPPAIEPDYKVIKSILPTANPDEYACCIAADMWNACRATMLQAEPVTTANKLGNSQVHSDCCQEQSPIDHGYRPECECSGCKATARICAELTGNSPVIPEGLVKAVHFYEQAKRENPPIETGVWKDAIDWVLKEACLAASTLESSREHEVISQQEKA
ncbi:TPA: molecular chaperone DnaJ [Salmonella enterica subsp. enterica serovar Typhimurium]